MTHAQQAGPAEPDQPQRQRWRRWAVLGTVLLVIGGLVALFGFGLTQDPKLVRSPLVGRQAPDFTVTRLGGEQTLRLSALQGTPVILNFWASWCVACRDEARVLQATHERHGGAEPEVRVVGIAVQDTPEAAQAFARTFGKTYFLALDSPEGDISLAYGLYGVPETFFIDAEGIIRHKTVGAVTEEIIRQQVAALTGGNAEGTQ